MFTEIKYLKSLSHQDFLNLSKRRSSCGIFAVQFVETHRRNKNKARGFIFQIKGKLALQVSQLWYKHEL